MMVLSAMPVRAVPAEMLMELRKKHHDVLDYSCLIHENGAA